MIRTPIRLTTSLALCCASHFLVDFACALAVVSLPSLSRVADIDYYPLVILYNLLAFGSQPFWGWLIDRQATYREGITAGILLTSFGAAITGLLPVVAVFLLGCGNALFHVGAGALVYNTAPGKAREPGLFVAPGGLGLVVGIKIGLRGTISPIWLVPLLIGTVIILHRLIPVAKAAALPASESGEKPEMLPMVLLLFLVVVGLRSFTGFAFPVAWTEMSSSVLLLALSSFAGKACGGILADRFGWRPFCGLMLLLAAATGIAHQAFLPAACIGLFCIQTTTGVTLAGVQSLFLGRPAFAFGLPCIALLFGAFPFFLPHPLGLIYPWLAAGVCVLAALASYGALTFSKNWS